MFQRVLTIGIILSLVSAAADESFTIPAATVIQVRTTTTISTKSQRSGYPFTATLTKPVIIAGRQVARRGATVEGRVIEATPGGRIKGRAHLALQLTSLQLADGQSVHIATNVAGRQAPGTKKRDAAKILGVGGTGAAIGALAAGGPGAAIGAAAGGVAGTGVVLATRGKPAVVPAESILTFRLRSPVHVHLR